MNISDCFYLGYISKAIGHQGELAFKLDVDSPSSYTDMDLVFVQMQAKSKHLVPFFINTSKLGDKGRLRCKIDDINTKKEAKALLGKSLYLPVESLPPLERDQFYFHEIINYKVVDKKKGNIGHVVEVLDTPSSHLLSISYQGKEILIPINDETIEGVEEKTLHVNAPEGLIDLYLEK